VRRLSNLSLTLSLFLSLLRRPQGPDFTLSVWDWRLERVELHTKAFGQDVYKVCFSPDDPTKLTTSGSGHLRFWRIAQTFTGLKLQGDLGKFGKVELSDVDDFAELPDGKVQSYSSDSKVQNLSSDSKVQSYSSDSKVQSYSSDSKVQSHSSDGMEQSYSLDSKVQSYSLDSKVQSYSLDSKVQSYSLGSKVQSFCSDIKVQSYSLDSKVQSYSLDSKVQSFSLGGVAGRASGFYIF
jgi:WD40 repeat protein